VADSVRDGVVAVHHGAGQGWRHDGVTLPCRHAWSAGLGEVAAHGNGVLALDALGGQVALLWHAWASVHGRPRGFLLQGIGSLGHDGAGSEVTGRGMVGGSLPTLGAHGGHGDDQGLRGVAGMVAAGWGRARVPTERRSMTGGRWRWVGQRSEGKG
jgi:hypothetical protein